MKQNQAMHLPLFILTGHRHTKPYELVLAFTNAIYSFHVDPLLCVVMSEMRIALICFWLHGLVFILKSYHFMYSILESILTCACHAYAQEKHLTVLSFTPN